MGKERALSLTRDDWTLDAKCQGMQDALFAEGAHQKKARVVCRDCPVRTECLAEALDNRIEWGVWGGMTERERRHLLRVRTDVSSWRSLLCGKEGSDQPK
ncbi:WhiB family transcriptional regulator [Granulicoccus phenolivorans]|uniref:WhiB family transcriptional regulator n=1 Tax=Granulicoccus phenolivorans TaxID=266854 RepID=UPI000478E3E5|nr:WhiB family transcriptional regulator [Granulicoccus phenolivorans]